MSEHNLSRYIRNLISAVGHVEKHEDRHKTGIPDLSYGICGVNGWIELKFTPIWPKGVVKLDHFTSDQRNWLKLRGRNGGQCWLLWQIEDHYFLFNHEVLDCVGKLNKAKLYRAAFRVWRGYINLRGFVDVLTSGVDR